MIYRRPPHCPADTHLRSLGAPLCWIVLLLLLTGCATAAPHVSAAAQVPDRTIPTLDDFWDGAARFVVDVADTGLPMGESDTVILPDGTWRSYLHASNPSLGVVDQCGNAVPFPGCLVTFTSHDAGRSFAPTRNAAGVPVCQIACAACPCDSKRDHIDQQQYPRVAALTHANAGPQSKDEWLLVYEYRANIILRRSADGLVWSAPAEVPLSGIWRTWLMPCDPAAAIGVHPYTPITYDCLIGSPPGIYIDTEALPPQLYVFVALGQNPSSLGCYRGPVDAPAALLRACSHNPLFVGAQEYGPTGDTPPAAANAFFDYRTISSADLVRVGTRVYLFYEGVRGPGAGDPGDTQFLLGLARSTTAEVDGAWERYAGNPILLDLPGNVGVGHADVVIHAGQTYLYTSLDGEVRSRLRLVWN